MIGGNYVFVWLSRPNYVHYLTDVVIRLVTVSEAMNWWNSERIVRIYTTLLLWLILLLFTYLDFLNSSTNFLIVDDTCEQTNCFGACVRARLRVYVRGAVRVQTRTLCWYSWHCQAVLLPLSPADCELPTARERRRMRFKNKTVMFLWLNVICEKRLSVTQSNEVTYH